jgi:branched-chain amino acid transport system permease protein
MLQMLMQFISSGLTTGALYALVGVGITITFNASGVINFSQGQFAMLGGMIAATLVRTAHWPSGLAMPLAVAAVSLIGVVMGIGMKYVENASDMRKILVTLGMSQMIEVCALIAWGTDPLMFRTPFPRMILRLLGATITLHAVSVLTITVLIMLLFTLYFRTTRWGRAMAATSINRMAAASLGINVSKVVAVAFGISALLGAGAGVLLTPMTAVSYSSGFLLTVKGFAAAIMGGLGSPIGAVAGGLTLGLVEAFGSGLLSSGYKDAITFGVLLLVIIVMPRGLFGRATRSA